MSLTQQSLAAMSSNWWALAIRGVVAILFGLLAFLWPSITLLALVFLFGAYAFVDGIFAIVGGIRSAGERRRWWLLLLEGIVGVAAGLIAFIWPDITALALLYIIAAWAVITGVLEIVIAVQLRRQIEGEWVLVLGGIVSVILGVVLAVLPAVGILSLVWLVGVYAVVFGILLLVLAFRLRRQQGSDKERRVI